MKKTSEKSLYQGQWLTIKQLELRNQHGQKIYWESIERHNSSDIIVILAQIIPSDQYVLIKQFRPAINCQVIGLPAGMVNGENIIEQALKELKEETGYTAKITDISPGLAFNPALTNEKVYFAHAEIDQNNPENLHHKQALEPTEEIEVVLVKAQTIREFLLNERAKGVQVSIALWYLFVVKC